jgi:cell wall-associated NlpC family hydrolase
VTQPVIEPGDAVVRVGVSTMWENVDAPRSCDAPAVDDVPDCAAWVAGLTDDERRGLQGRTLTQLLLGDPVIIEEITDGWARVVALGQTRSGRDPRGYPGWVPAAHLVNLQPGEAPSSADVGQRYVVDALVSTLLDRPGSGSAALDVVLGTLLTAVGPARDRYLPVAVAGQVGVLWAKQDDLAVPGAEAGAEQIVAVARRFAGVRYVWGGTSPYGIDCSGLVYVAHRRFGVTVPRDADDQADAAERVDREDQRPGRLVFFADDRRHIDHVGIVDGPGQLLHASGRAARVQSEPLAGDLAARVESVRRTVA